MIDYIAVTKHFQNKDKPFLNNCQIKAFYKDTNCTKYTLNGCNDLELYWYENSNTFKLKGSITYFIQGHNFTYAENGASPPTLNGLIHPVLPLNWP